MFIFAYIDPPTMFTVSGGLAALLGWGLSGLAGLLALWRYGVRAMRRHPLAWGMAAAAVVLVLATAVFCVSVFRDHPGNQGSETGKMRGRVIILAFDGMSPTIVEPMMAAGALPAFRKLRDMGCYRRLGTTNPPQSPVAWASFATGRNPGSHGVFDFIRRTPGSYIPEIVTTRFVKGSPVKVRSGKAFWEYCAEAGIPAVVLACPVTFPPDDKCTRMLSGMGVPDLLGTQGTFSFFTTEAREAAGDVGGRVFVLPPGDSFAAALPGPLRQGLTGKPTPLSVPFHIQLRREERRCVIQIDGTEVSVAEGAWSGWVHVRFLVGPLRSMHGLVRFHLVSTAPVFRLFATPVCTDPAKPWFPVSQPRSYVRELAAELGSFSTRGMPYETWGLNEGRISDDAFLAEARDLLGERIRIYSRELNRCRKGLLFCYFDYPDIIQHMFWRFSEPGAAGTAPAPGEVIRDAYKRMDEIVALTLKELKPEDTLIVLSDHGFTSFQRSLNLNTWLRANGYLALTDPGAPAGGPLFQDVDWSRTRAYALGFGGIYLNLRGREPEGIVSPGPEAQELKREIAAKLDTWMDLDRREKPVHRVYLREDIFHGGRTAEAPDLEVGTSESYGVSWQTALGEVPAGEIEDNARKWSGTHLVDPELVPGVLFCSRTMAETSPTLYSLFPTVLELFGIRKRSEGEDAGEGVPLL